MSRLIAFTGGMGTGKSTAINFITNLGRDNALPVKLVKFAGPLYDMQEMIYGRISPVIKRQEDFKKDRKLLQWLGTDWGRDTISKTLWVDLWKADVEAALSDLTTIVVCDDVRFDNEAETVHALGGKVIKLVANDRRGAEVGIAGHASEAGVSERLVDAVIHNNGSISEFESAVAETLLSFNK